MDIKERSASVISYFANKELSVGCITDAGIITSIDGMELRLDGGFRYVSKGQAKRGAVKIIGHPVMIGDILEYMAMAEIDDEFHGHETTLDRMLLSLWSNCGDFKKGVGYTKRGFTKSLNEILSGETYDDMKAGEREYVGVTGGGCVAPVPNFIATEQFKDPNTQALLEFLEGLI